MDASNTFDNGSDYLVVDDLASIYGLIDYADLANTWGSSWSSEVTWAKGEASSINTALDNYLTAYTIPRVGGGAFNACLNSCNMLSGGYSGNWLGTTLMMGELPWDGALAGNTNLGAWSNYLTGSVYADYTERASNAPSIPPDSWGAWSNGSSGYGTVYNAGAGVQLLGSSDPIVREQPIDDLEWLAANQSAPMQWGESFSQGSWSTPEADLETWGESGSAKALLESNISVAANGNVIIGAGIPASWILSGQPTSWTNVPVGAGKTVGFTITPESGNQVQLTLTAATSGQVLFELPMFVNNISSASAGTVNQSAGSVTLSAGTTSTTVTLDNESAPAITVASSTAASYAFGEGSDQEQRAQTFFASDAPTVTGVQVDIAKANGTGQSNVTVGLYPATNGTPNLSDPLATNTIPAANVGTSATIISVPLSYTGLVQGQQYAVVLSQVTLGTADYVWETSGSDGVDTFEKYTGSGWTNESDLGNAWLTVNVSGNSIMAANLANNATAAYSFGQSTDQVTRGQMFVDTGIKQLTDVRVDIQTFNGSGQTPVTVGLYNVLNGQPTGSALATNTIPVASVGSSPTIIDVALSYGSMVPGEQYAIVLGQQTPGTGGYYEWETTGSNGINGFGKFQPAGNWVDESNLGDAWLQVNGTLGGSSGTTYPTYTSTTASFTQSGGAYSIDAAGTDVWSPYDQYGAIYAPSSADATSSTTVEVNSQQNTNSWAKAGIMLRNSIPGSGTALGYAMLALTPGNGIVLQWDDDSSGYLNTYVSADSGATAPIWLRLTRSGSGGSTVTGYYSTNDSTWTEVGSATLTGANSTEDVGIFACSHDTGVESLVDFSNFSITG
jgi:hypothetical protein